MTSPFRVKQLRVTASRRQDPVVPQLTRLIFPISWEKEAHRLSNIIALTLTGSWMSFQSSSGMSERMSDSFILHGLPWSTEEYHQIALLIDHRRKNTGKLFVTFMVLCCMTYIASDLPFLMIDDSKPSTSSNDSSQDRSSTSDSQTSSSAQGLIDQMTSLEIVLGLLCLGFIIMTCILNRLRDIERDLDIRIQRTFGIAQNIGPSTAIRRIEQEDERMENGEIQHDDEVNQLNRERDRSGVANNRMHPYLSVFIPSTWGAWSRSENTPTRDPQGFSLFGLFRPDSRQVPQVQHQVGVSRSVSDQWSRLLVKVQSAIHNADETKSLLYSSTGSLCVYNSFASCGDPTILQKGKGKDFPSSSTFLNELSDEDSTVYNGQRGKEKCTQLSKEPENTITVDAGADCSICLLEYKEGDTVVCLPCRHVYHDECLSPWITKSVHCPLCKYNLEKQANDIPEE